MRGTLSSGFSLGAGLEGHGRFGRKVEESESFLQVKPYILVGMAQVADGGVLADMKIEVATTGGDHESTVNGGRPDDFAFDQPFDVIENGIAVVAGFSEFGVG